MLLEEAPGFGNSEEFRGLDKSDRELPSVALGAFTRYIERLHSDNDRLTGHAEGARVAEAFAAIDRLASSKDPEVVNALVVDVFEHLNLPDDLLEEFRSRLGPAAIALYDRWVGPPRGTSG